MTSSGLHEANIFSGEGRIEAAEVREEAADFVGVEAIPLGEGCGVLVHREGGQPAASARVVRSIDGKVLKLAEHLPAIDGTTNDDVMTTPAVVTSLTVRREGAREIRGCEGSDSSGERLGRIGSIQLLHGPLEGEHGLADLTEEPEVGACRIRRLIGEARTVHLGGVRVKAADRDVKNLTFHVEPSGAIGGDQACDHLELSAESGIGEAAETVREATEGRVIDASQAGLPFMRLACSKSGDLLGIRVAARGRIRGVICRGNVAIEQVADFDRAIEHIGVGLALEVRIAERHDVFHGLNACSTTTHHSSAAQGDGSRGGDVVLRNKVTDLKGVGSSDGNAHGDFPTRVGNRVVNVGNAAAPAGGRRLVRDGGLPLSNLVTVGEELRRTVGGEAGGVVRLGRWADEGADVLNNSELLFSKEGLEMCTTGMKAISATLITVSGIGAERACPQG